MEATKIDRAKITDAINAIRGNAPSEILDSVSQLTETERTVVSLVLELSSAPKVGRPRGRKSKIAAIAESKAS